MFFVESIRIFSLVASIVDLRVLWQPGSITMFSIVMDYRCFESKKISSSSGGVDQQRIIGFAIRWSVRRIYPSLSQHASVKTPSQYYRSSRADKLRLGW